MKPRRQDFGSGFVAMIEAAEAARQRGETVRITMDFTQRHSVGLFPERLEQDTGNYRILAVLRAPTLDELDQAAREDIQERNDPWSGVAPKAPAHRPGRA